MGNLFQAIRQEEARKMGLVIQFEATEEEVEEMMAQEQLNSTWKVFRKTILQFY